jgi:hypothetical protein
LISGIDWAIAGAATDADAAPRPATPIPFRNLRLASLVIPFLLGRVVVVLGHFEHSKRRNAMRGA